MKRFKTSKGFTLIEIIVVMSILTVLMGIGIYVYPRYKEQSFITEDSTHEKLAADEAITEYLTSGTFGDIEVITDDENYKAPEYMYWDAKNEIWADDTTGIKPYGKCTKLTHDHRNGILAGKMDKYNGELCLVMEWVDGNDEPITDKLCSNIKVNLPVTEDTLAMVNPVPPLEPAPVPALKDNLEDWNYSLDGNSGIVTLNYYTGSKANVFVDDCYIVGGKIYRTQLASNEASFKDPDDTLPKDNLYMFNRSAQAGNANIQSITFSDGLDTSNVTSMRLMFNGCSNLTEINFGKRFTAENVTDMKYMFNNCDKLKSIDLSALGDTSKVKSMERMFQFCYALESIDLSVLNTRSVENMYAMFNECESLKSINLKGINTSKVKNMERMFQFCKKLESIDMSGLDTSSVENMCAMFNDCWALTSINLKGINTEKVKNMLAMFRGCKELTQLDLSSFDTSNVETMERMFLNCEKLRSLDLRSFNTGEVKTMFGMFNNCRELQSIKITNFDTTQVANMAHMFSGCGKLTKLNLESFDTNNVDDMHLMFNGCKLLKVIDVTSGKWLTKKAAANKNIEVRKDVEECKNTLKILYGITDMSGTQNMFSSCGTNKVTYK